MIAPMVNVEQIRMAARLRMRAWRERKNPKAERLIAKEKQKEARFWAKVSQTEDGCWLWTAYCNQKGYGRVGAEGRKVKSAHRVAWELMYGPILNGLHVLHRCDNPSCVRPDHLFLGTNKDNAGDREAKGRGNQPRGLQNGNAKLTDAFVKEILANKGTMTQARIAGVFGVTRSTISKVLLGKSWRHVAV